MKHRKCIKLKIGNISFKDPDFKDDYYIVPHMAVTQGY